MQILKLNILVYAFYVCRGPNLEGQGESTDCRSDISNVAPIIKAC
jgi:hypothetical protein